MQQAGPQNAEETTMNQFHPLGNMILFGCVAFLMWIVIGTQEHCSAQFVQMEHRPWTINKLQSLLCVSSVILGVLLVVYGIFPGLALYVFLY